MILELYFEQRTSKSGRKTWYARVQCDDCGKIRVVSKDNLKGCSKANFCKSCFQKGARNHAFGKPISEEALRKRSLMFSGNKNPMYGKHHTEATKKILSDKQKGEKSHNWGKSASAETRKKIGDGHRGKIVREETRNLLSIINSGENSPWFGKKHSEATKKKMSDWRRGKFCGENSPNWKPEKTRDQRVEDRNIEGYDEWHRQVLRRDKWTCEITGVGGQQVVTHHLYNYMDYPDKRTDVNNGKTADEYLHKRFHKIYGNRYNTPEQWNQFKQSILNSYC